MRKTFLTLPALLILLAGCSTTQPVSPVNPQVTSAPTQQDSQSYLIRFQNDHSKFGFQDETGKIVIQPQFDYAEPFSDGLAAVKISASEDKGKWGFIDKTGHYVIQPQFDLVHSFSEDMALVAIGEWKQLDSEEVILDLIEGKWGYVDKTGKFVIVSPYPPQLYRYASSFQNGLANINSYDDDGTLLKSIYIDKQGKVIKSVQKAPPRSPLNTALDAIKNAITKTIGSTNNFGEDRNITIQYDGTNLDIAYIGDENLTPTMSKDSLKMTDSFKILKAILPYLGGAKTVTLRPSLKANDRYGNTTYDTALRIKISTAVLNKINWNNTSSIDIQNIADSYWEAPGL